MCLCPVTKNWQSVLGLAAPSRMLHETYNVSPRFWGKYWTVWLDISPFAKRFIIYHLSQSVVRFFKLRPASDERFVVVVYMVHLYVREWIRRAKTYTSMYPLHSMYIALYNGLGLSCQKKREVQCEILCPNYINIRIKVLIKFLIHNII